MATGIALGKIRFRKISLGIAGVLFTGILAGHFGYRIDLEYFAIPGVAGSGLVAFPVLGNSIEPVIHNDDIAICREVNGLLEVRDNEIYADKNNGQLWVKYVQRMFNQKGRVTHLKLISANYLEHDPWIEEVNENTRLYKVIRKISAV